MRVYELKAIAANMGLATTGSKELLVERLEQEGSTPCTTNSDFVTTTTTPTTMTGAQEVANALSMVVPTLVVAAHYYSRGHDGCFWHEHTLALALGTLCHLPFSFGYHMLCAANAFEDRIDCAARRLDQTFIHVACVAYSYGTSGIGLYAAGSGIVNAWYIAKLWMQGPHDNAFERRTNVLVGTLLYTVPMVRYGWRSVCRSFSACVALFPCARRTLPACVALCLRVTHSATGLR